MRHRSSELSSVKTNVTRCTNFPNSSKRPSSKRSEVPPGLGNHTKLATPVTTQAVWARIPLDIASHFVSDFGIHISHDDHAISLAPLTSAACIRPPESSKDVQKVAKTCAKSTPLSKRRLKSTPLSKISYEMHLLSYVKSRI